MTRFAIYLFIWINIGIFALIFLMLLRDFCAGR